MFVLNLNAAVPLVQQIVDGFRQLVDEGGLRAGAKAPSIRHFANMHAVSVHTVVDAYDRLVAQGYFVSRPHQGFFVRHRTMPVSALQGVSQEQFNFDSMWYLRRIFENRSLRLKPGCGWMPGDWLFGDGVRKSLRTLSTDNVDLGGYGEPKGYLPLRQLVRDLLAEQEIAVTSERVLLTHGSSQAMDLVARRLVKPGDAVLVDDPGYPNMLFSLRFLQAKLLGVPRTPAGYDLKTLEDLVAAHRPKVFFTQPRLHSPTGSVAQLSHLHRVMQLAEKYDFIVVENDIYADLDPQLRPSLASLDQLRRVVYISSFSKTISPNIRVGYLAAHPDLLEDVAQLKMVSGLTSSEFTERLAYGALLDTRWRRHLKLLRERLARAHEFAADQLMHLGFELFSEPKAGIFLWARHPQLPDATELAYRAGEHDMLLGPGSLFSAHMQPCSWMRFNVSFCEDPDVFRFFAEQLKPSVPS